MTTLDPKAAAARDLADIAEVLGPEFADAVLLSAPSDGSGWHRRAVAEFAREVRDHMFADPAWTPARTAAMRRWLREGEVEFDGVVRRPAEALLDPTLAGRVLAELESATR